MTVKATRYARAPAHICTSNVLRTCPVYTSFRSVHNQGPPDLVHLRDYVTQLRARSHDVKATRYARAPAPRSTAARSWARSYDCTTA